MGNQSSSTMQFGCVSCGPQDDQYVTDSSLFKKTGWKKILYKECEQISDKCRWARYFLKQSYGSLKSQPIEGYIVQFQAAHQQYKSQHLKNYRKSYSYQNNMNASIKQNPESSIKQILQNTDLTVQQLEILTTSSAHRQDASVSLQILEKKPSESIDQDENLLHSKLSYYVDIIKLLKQQISNQDHQLNIFLHFFIDSFKRQYNMDRCKKQLQNASQDLKEFARIFQICIENYYQYEKTQMSIGPVTDLFNNENMLTSIYSMLFSKEIVYQITFDMALEYLRTEIDLFKQQIENFYNQDIEFYEISVKFRLNKSTHTYLLKKYSQCEMNFRESPPYHKCIKLLNQIKEKQSPQQKFKSLIYCLEKIIKQIKHFYNQYGCEYDMQIESADLISIYMYIIIKSQIFDIQVHLYFIEHFVTNKSNYGSCGYQLTSVQAAIKMILQLKL